MVEIDPLLGITGIVILGVTAQWIAWRLRIPSILILLFFGFIVGPLYGFLNPTKLLGDLLHPVVSLSVAIILFEGGLGLKVRELEQVGRVVRNLITFGALINWALMTAAAYYLLDLRLEMSLLLGAILIVTGPTVVIPLLREIRPGKQLLSVLKWEGIVIDPVGAMVAVLTFEAILAGEAQSATSLAVFGVANTILVGSIIGFLGARILLFFLGRYAIPDHLQSPVTLMFVIATFTLSNNLQPESGLLTATVLGITLANQVKVNVRQIVEFKETLGILLISVVFVLLAAKLDLDNIHEIPRWQAVGFIAFLIFVARPISAYASTMRSELSRKERFFVACLAPRGIVAAAVASIFSYKLVELNHPGAEELVTLTFLVIFSTVIFYSITAPFIA
ncbi:MAG: sodium:proton antiporter, partial [Bdellovibrionales bacterium]|nr:sodium:proton antiporter [Bdellovibrionales bacterium]